MLKFPFQDREVCFSLPAWAGGAKRPEWSRGIASFSSPSFPSSSYEISLFRQLESTESERSGFSKA